MPALGSLNHDPLTVAAAPRLSVERSLRGVRVSLVRGPGVLALCREASLQVAGVVGSGLAVTLGIYLFGRPDGEWRPQAIACGVVAVIGAVATIFDACRNCGVVTEIKVDGDQLVWSKRSLWGRRDGRWPVETIKRAHAHGWSVRWGQRRQVASLVIDRREGWPLTAFVRHPIEELCAVASALNEALGKHV
jgi:hypothetical protein